MNLPDLSVMAGAGIAAAITAAVSFWSQARNFARYLASFLLLQKEVHGSLSTPVGQYIRRSYRKAPSGLSIYRSLLLQVDDRTIGSHVPFEMPVATGIWWGKRGIFVVSASSNLTLVSLRWVSDPQQLIVDALEDQTARSTANLKAGTGNFWVKRVIGTAGDNFMSEHMPRRRETSENSASSLDSPVSDNHYWQSPDVEVDTSFMYSADRYVQNRKRQGPFHGLFFPEHVEQVISDVRRWYAREDWYRSHGIPWRMGVLLHGPGGTGKSSLARALAQMLGVPLCQFYLNTLTDREFIDKWDDLPTPCVVALEDFDTVFHGREAVTVHKSLSFECVLNSISGISSINGILLVVTTNNLQHIDPALGQLDTSGRPTRPGRIDHILHMGETTLEQRRRIAEFTLNGWASELMDELLASGEGTTAAQFQFMCVNAALQRLATEKQLSASR